MVSGNSHRTVWQLSGGPANRSYISVLLEYGVGLIGPGDAGRWTPGRPDEEFGGSSVRRFAGEMKIGDIVLLRTGTSRICAVGIVAGEYEYLEQFDDVNGWDLQHARRIRWRRHDYDFGRPVFGAIPPRLSLVRREDVRSYAVKFVNSPPDEWQAAVLPPLPAPEEALGEIPEAIRPLVGLAYDLLPLYWDRARFGDVPSEDELLVHFLVPLLRALGWPPELVAVKWRNIDVAVFRALPRIPENCHLVIEAKRFGAGIEGALEQARNYVSTLGMPIDVVVTDGLRYRMYSARKGFAPVAYASLTNLKRRAVDLLERLRNPQSRAM